MLGVCYLYRYQPDKKTTCGGVYGAVQHEEFNLREFNMGEFNMGEFNRGNSTWGSST